MAREPIISPATRAQLARASLADARRLIRDAQEYKEDANPNGLFSLCWSPLLADRHEGKAAQLLAEARTLIASARTMYAEAMRACAQRGQLTHHYVPVLGDRYRAAVHVPGGATVWASLTTYGRRQSAQRAAANHIGRLARQGV